MPEKSGMDAALCVVLMATAKTDSLTKFIAERQDTGNMRTFLLAS
jgi:hypothetical protein